MTKNDALKLAVIIINEIEGGYYHPDMKPYLQGGAAMLDSGETMYGLDRVKGNIENTETGKEFYKIVDKYYSAHHADKNYYNDKAEGKKNDIPAAVGVQLKKLAAEIIYNRFVNYSKALSAKAKEIVLADPALLLQFFYAVYNGQGNFNKFAEVVNDAIKRTQNAKKIYQLLQQKRRTLGAGDAGNALFKKGADKLDDIIIKYYNLDYADKKSRTWFFIAGGLLLFLILKNRKK